MSWAWDQSAGTLSHNGQVVARGYAGHGDGKNNPLKEAAPGIGPVPHGRWFIGPPHDSPNTGPYTMDLTPAPGTDAHGRSLFRIHGESIADPGNASHGCIIVSRQAREMLWKSGAREIEVVA